jgi:hypothetical protein
MAANEFWTGHGLHQLALVNERHAAVLFLGRSGGADAADDSRGHGVSCALPEHVTFFLSTLE